MWHLYSEASTKEQNQQNWRFWRKPWTKRSGIPEALTTISFAQATESGLSTHCLESLSILGVVVVGPIRIRVHQQSIR